MNPLDDTTPKPRTVGQDAAARVLLVGRHFWPSSSFDRTGYLCQLATGFHRGGLHVEILTPRYAASWPQRFCFREMLVHRPAAAPRSDWSMGRYIRHQATWLKEYAQSYDALIVDAIREEALAVTEAGRSTETPVALICSGWGDRRDPVWWQTSRSARRCGAAAKSADHVIVKDAQSERLLISHGITRERLHRIDIGFASSLGISEDTRDEVRARLGRLNSDLFTMPDTPVIVCCGRMERDGAMDLLARSARFLASRYPDLRIWFIGDGPYRENLYDMLRSDGVRSSIAMPGTFADISDVLLSADLFVQADEQGLDFGLPSAVSAAIPIVAMDVPAVRSLLELPADSVGHTESVPCNVSLFKGATSKSLRAAIRGVLDNLPAARERAMLLRRYLTRTRPQSKAIDAYMKVIGTMKSKNRRVRSVGPPDSNTIEAAS
ncbi:Glycosyl transferases group 1 [Planctomycetes bacterium CA13]|uniref:Glycosyl transferases group 1 n=1 Tax=Novipirellula herctigrandis TaxID=2527986 RepID=A0A5C5YWN0_9BACT|nr:Glycosyl transferases group 1 [Planctomycetes bacterium CA13]